MFSISQLTRRPLGDSNLRYRKMERNLRRLKNRPYPKLPKNAEEIGAAFKEPEILEEFGFNLRGNERFYVNTTTNSSSSFTIFASKNVMNMIRDHIPPKERRYLLDATFDVTPLGSYYQLLIIYIEYKNDVFPIAYIAMSDKKTETYEAVFIYIQNYVFEMEPSAFMTDFEGGLRKALRKCFICAKLHTCWYHYTAAVRKRFRRLQMTKLIKNNADARTIYKKLLSLPLLPPDDIVKGYELIKEEAKKKLLKKQFEKIFLYFQRFWLKIVSIGHNIKKKCRF